MFPLTPQGSGEFKVFLRGLVQDNPVIFTDMFWPREMDERCPLGIVEIGQ